MWQECYDDVSGFIYYWNTQTNKVTWEKPEHYEAHIVEENQGIVYIIALIDNNLKILIFILLYSCTTHTF